MGCGERLMAPYQRTHQPLGWISDGAAVVGMSTTEPRIGPAYRVEGIDAVYADRRPRRGPVVRAQLLQETMQLVERYWHTTPPTGIPCYPAFDEDVLTRLHAIAPGRAWMNGRHGMSFGIDLLAALTACGDAVHMATLCLIEPGRAVIGVRLHRVR